MAVVFAHRAIQIQYAAEHAPPCAPEHYWTMVAATHLQHDDHEGGDGGHNAQLV